MKTPVQASEFERYLSEAKECIGKLQSMIDDEGFDGFSQEQANQLISLISSVRSLRDNYIRHLFHDCGRAGKEIATMFDLTPARVSQICAHRV